MNKKTDAISGLKQTINGQEAYVHTLPATNALIVATVAGHKLATRGTELNKQMQELESELKLLHLDIMKIKEQQTQEIKKQFDTSNLPTAPQVVAEIQMDKNEKPTGIAFYLKSDRQKCERYHDTAQAIEDFLDL